MDPFDIFERQTDALLQCLGRDHPRYPEALMLQIRLRENIAQARLYGDTETRRADRAQVLDALNRLSLETLGLALPDLPDKLLSPALSDKRGVQVGGDVVGSVIITGDGNVVRISPTSPPPAPAPTRPERGPLPLARAQVRIYAADGERIVGSGFLAGEREVLTCAHVVTCALDLPDDTPEPPPGQVSLDFPLLAPGQRLAARVARWRPQDDIAVLELESAPPAGAEPAPLAEGGDLWGHPFRAFGFPAGHPEGVWASGVVRGPTTPGWLQIEDTKETGYRVQPGFSGAPVWDDNLGGVVGMVAAAEGDPSVRAAFIIPAALLSKIVQPATRRTLHATHPLPSNPFTDILAIQDPARFIGRERLLERVLQWLQAGSVALVGERKIGKSSVLWQLKQRLEQEASTLFWDFFEPISARQLLREAIARLGGSGDTWEDFRTALRGQRVVLLLDELDLALERGFDLDMLRGCRALCQREPGFRLITASRVLPKDIFPRPERGSTPWDFLQVLVVGPFTEEEAQRLLDHPWAPEALPFDPATCRELIALSGRHPYRLQRAAHHRYEALADPDYDWRAGYERDMEAWE